MKRRVGKGGLQGTCQGRPRSRLKEIAPNPATKAHSIAGSMAPGSYATALIFWQVEKPKYKAARGGGGGHRISIDLFDGDLVEFVVRDHGGYLGIQETTIKAAVKAVSASDSPTKMDVKL